MNILQLIPIFHSNVGNNTTISAADLFLYLFGDGVHLSVCALLFSADIPEEVLETCGAADCGLSIEVNSTTSRPSQNLVWTLVGSYIGNITA